MLDETQDIFGESNNKWSPHESAIEKMMADALSRVGLTNLEMKVTPQAKVGKYRVDLLVQVRFNILNSDVVSCVVECDGFEYHSTREQIIHDMRRQKEIVAMGYMVARFTGSQIYRDGDSCAEDVFSMMRHKHMVEGLQ